MNASRASPAEARREAARGREALASGNRLQARRAAHRALGLDPACEQGWLLLAALAPRGQRRGYLEHVLGLHPSSRAARSALAALERELQGLAIAPAPRRGSVAGAPGDTQPIRANALRASPRAKGGGWVWAATGVLVSCLLVATATAFARSANAEQSPMVFDQLAKDFGTATPTITPTFTPTATPTFTPLPTATFIPSPTFTPRPSFTPGSAAGVSPRPQPSSGGEHWIDVDLSSQRVYAYEGNTVVRTFLVSTGTAAHPTVTGRFRIYAKYLYDDMAGPDYYLPNVPYTMYFYEGYSLHGTYWHHNFGHPMSHGCVNMRTPDAGWVFSWAPIGTLVNVHY